MRKTLVCMLVLALCLSFVPGSAAAEQGQTEGEEEALVLAEFTLENARELIGYYGWEGVTGSVAKTGIRFWRPAALQRVELSQKMIDAGYIDAFYASNCTLSVILQNYEIDLKEYQDIVESSGYGNVRVESVNGRDFVIYDEPQKDGSFCRVAGTQQSEGQILEFVFHYADEYSKDVGILLDTVIATIREEESTQG